MFQLYTKALAEDCNNDDVLVNRAQAYLKLNRFQGKMVIAFYICIHIYVFWKKHKFLPTVKNLRQIAMDKLSLYKHVKRIYKPVVGGKIQIRVHLMIISRFWFMIRRNALKFLGFSEAVADCDKAVQLNCKNVKAYLRKGWDALLLIRSKCFLILQNTKNCVCF